MKKARLKFDPFQTIEVKDITKFLSGSLDGMPSWTVTDWIVHGEGFRINSGVTFLPEIKE